MTTKPNHSHAGKWMAQPDYTNQTVAPQPLQQRKAN
jgi:hypothetical protein